MVNDLADERAVMVCPQCEGEGGYPDGMDEEACFTDCTRCGGDGWIVDMSALRRPVPADVARLLERIAGGGPNEWGYRDPVTGDFIADNWPFEAAALLTTLASGRDEWLPLCQDYAENELKECLDAMPLPRDDKLLIAEMRKRGLWVYRRPTPPQGDQQ